MYIGNIFLLILSIPLVGIFVRLVHVRATVLAPITVMVTMLGVYTINNSTFNMWLVIFFGVVGYLMKKTGFEPGPLVLAFVLGRILETSFRQSLRIFEGEVTEFLTRPISGALVALMILMVVLLPAFQFVRRRARRRGQGSSD